MKIVYLNLDKINVGDSLVDFGDIPDFENHLNEDQTDLISIPSFDDSPCYAVVKQLYTENDEKHISILWTNDPVPQTVKLNLLTDKNGWDRVVIVTEQELLAVRLKACCKNATPD